MIRSFGDRVFNSTITISKVEKKQCNLLINVLGFNSKARIRSKADKKKNRKINRKCKCSILEK